MKCLKDKTKLKFKMYNFIFIGKKGSYIVSVIVGSVNEEMKIQKKIMYRNRNNLLMSSIKMYDYKIVVKTLS